MESIWIRDGRRGVCPDDQGNTPGSAPATASRPSQSGAIDQQPHAADPACDTPRQRDTTTVRRNPQVSQGDNQNQMLRPFSCSELPGHQRGEAVSMSPYASSWASSVVTAGVFSQGCIRLGRRCQGGRCAWSQLQLDHYGRVDLLVGDPAEHALRCWDAASGAVGAGGSTCAVGAGSRGSLRRLPGVTT
jgi:hypothetical protein